MYIELNNKSQSLGGLSDLTVLAPIKKGLVPSLEAITYKTRVRRVLKMLQILRESSHEYALFRPVSDSAERVGRIHSFRVAIVEPEDKLLLAVTFDGARESYMRVLWQKIGTLLDLLFCSTEGYVCAYGHTLAEWAAWIDRVQVSTDFFYGRPGVTSEDVVFLRDEERERQLNPDPRDADLAAVRRVTPSAEAAAWELANGAPAWVAEAARQGIQTVAVLHRLTAWFIPETPDGRFLHRAARDLLPEFRKLVQDRLLEDVIEEARVRFSEPLDWFLQPFALRDVPDAPTVGPDGSTTANIQGGILSAYENVTHGALLFLAFKPQTSAGPFWNIVEPLITRASEQPLDGRLVCNVAITSDGLRAAGLTESELAEFPFEFREGMAARCSVLGDFRTNHPRRWELPVRNWQAGAREGEAIELSAVHVLVQLRIGNAAGTRPEDRFYELGDARHPLHPFILQLENGLAGCMEFLSRQPMVRHREMPTDPQSKVVEHFGYADGESQPVLNPAENGKIYKGNLIHLGELLVGDANASDLAPPDFGQDAGASWLADGTFLVVRKLRQDVAQFNQLLADAATNTGLAADAIAAKLMGRKKDATPLAMPGTRGNDFDYKHDETGKLCPLHAHIRRANPRAQPDRDLPPLPPGERAPRIMRRGMSYGPRYDAAAAADADVNRAERGMLFMAYNASIAEQFEVLQRWLTGGNATGGYSGHSDPFVGVPESGQKRIFRFECPINDATGVPVDTVVRIPLDGDGDPVKLADPIVQLEWGMYLFTPSIAALVRLRRRANEKIPAVEAQWPWTARRGRVEIERLQRMQAEEPALTQAWKAVLEDPDAQKDFLSASVWASIREDFGGVLRTPYGVVVASHDLVMQVLRDPQRRYTVNGYRERATATIGDIYLGLDDQGSGCPYRKRSTIPNASIMRLDKKAAFDSARSLARAAVAYLIRREKGIAMRTGSAQWQLTFSSKEVVDRVLEGMCQEWFGLPADGPQVKAGAFRWDWDPRSATLYPGNFASPSRYIFQPNPGDEVLRIGSLHGRTMHAAFKAWVKEMRDADPPRVPTQPNGSEAQLAKAIFDAFPRSGRNDPPSDDQQDTLTAETMIGALIGFLPTVDGNLRQSLNEWLKDGTFWSLRGAMTEAEGAAAFASPSVERVEAELRLSMQLRPAAELVWRQPLHSHMIGNVPVEGHDTIVVSIVSATHELLEKGIDDVSPIFGGARKTDPVHPTHACPAYEAAMGVMLGVLTALLETANSMRPTPMPLTFRLEGPMLLDPEESAAAQTHPVLRLDPMHSTTLIVAATGGLNLLASENIATGLRATRLRNLAFDLKAKNIQFGPVAPAAAAPPIGFGHWLLLEGDSWFKYPSGALFDIADYLQATHKFTLSNLAKAKDELADISLRQVADLCDEFNDMKQRGMPPVAILLSAGGNDVVNKKLLPLVKPLTEGGGLDLPTVARIVDGTMRTQIKALLSTIGINCQLADGSPVPVFLLGYDYPVPDGRNIFGVVFPGSAWLRDSLQDRGYDVPGGLDIMHKLIDRLNVMQSGLCTEPAFAGHVFHADLRGTLSTVLQGNAYKADWANELHPTPSGFERLTQRLVVDYLRVNLPTLQ